MFHYVIPSLEPNPPPSPLPPWNPSATSNPHTSSQAVEETVFPRKQNQGSHWLHCVEGTLGASHSESTKHTKLGAKIKCRSPRIFQRNEQCGHVRKGSQVHSGKWWSVEGRRELRTRADSSARSSFGIHDRDRHSFDFIKNLSADFLSLCCRGKFSPCSQLGLEFSILLGSLDFGFQLHFTQ